MRNELTADGRAGAEERFLIAPFQVGLTPADGRWLVVEPKPPLQPTPGSSG